MAKTASKSAQEAAPAAAADEPKAPPAPPERKLGVVEFVQEAGLEPVMAEVMKVMHRFDKFTRDEWRKAVEAMRHREVR